MSRILLPLILGAAWPASAFGQAVLLDESFAGPGFPPPAWEEQNNGVSPGWEPAGARAVHADYFGANDNRLLTPALDLSAGTSFGLHLNHGQLFASYRDRNEIELSLDGGATFTWIGAVDTPQDGQDLLLEIDLSAWAGQPAVRLAFRYLGDFANEWSLDRVLVDDQAPMLPSHWPELPTSFVAWDGYCERFDGLAGGVPPHFGVNSVDAWTREPDAEGWCNVGQLAPPLVGFSGTAALELGLNPSSSQFHLVANALILGFDGTGASNTAFEMMVAQFDEELHADDGLFLSVDGVDWVPLRTDWERMTGGPSYAGQWRKVSADVASAGQPLDGTFYLAIAQADDFPFGAQDGVAIDDLCCGGAVVPLRYELQNAVGGQNARFTVTGADSDAFVAFLYSFAGPGPSTTPYGLAEVGSPYGTLAVLDADRNGRVSFELPVPARLTGSTVWSQAIEILEASGRFTNAIELVIQ